MTDSTSKIMTLKQDYLVAMLAALAIVIHVLESGLPSPVPGIKPGLANIITLIVFMRFGIRMAVWVSLLRVLVGSLLLGTFLSPTFILSLGGALSALVALLAVDTVFRHAGSWRPGPVGYCMVAAVAHMTAQFFLAYVFFIQHDALLALFPLLAGLSAVFGLVSGLLAAYMLNHVNRLGADDKGSFVNQGKVMLSKQVQG